jgi:hypothetical protein
MNAPMNLLVTNTRNAQAYAIIRFLRPFAQKIVVTMEGNNHLAARISHAASSCVAPSFGNCCDPYRRTYFNSLKEGFRSLIHAFRSTPDCFIPLRLQFSHQVSDRYKDPGVKGYESRRHPQRNAQATLRGRQH